MANKGLECPWCGFIPNEEETHFRTIVTERMKGKVIRGKVCPKCGRDFISEELALKQPFYKKKYIEESLSNG
jgi:hypothetical protein